MQKLKWIPNFLSSMRLVIALIFYLIPPPIQLSALVLAFLTEYLDGYLARKYKWQSLSGQLLDPIADKALCLTVGLTFVLRHKITLSQLVFISIRDIVAGLGFIIIVYFFKKSHMRDRFFPNFLGKSTTAMQYLVFFDILLTPKPHTVLILLTGLLSSVAAFFYSLNIYLRIK